ncbi:MAG TPA: hypothetical protein VGD05_01170 [Pyrinomonadaceae bacterium]|jgi:hypothetical protein
MTKPNFIFKATSVLVLCLLSSAISFAQTDTRTVQVEPSYEVVLQVVVGSNVTAQKTNLPANLAVVTKNLRNNFTFSNYSLSDTYIGRVANTGSIEYKTLSNNFGQAQNSQTPSFLDWTLGSLRSAPNGKGQNAIQIQPFRFGARVPVITGGGVVNYESIGLNMHRISLPENAPTLIGTLPTLKTGETIFLVLTVRPVEE